MKYRKDVYRSLTLITQFGINMLVPILICSFIGLFIDKKLGTSFVFVLLFFIGAIAGGRNVFILARKFYSKPSESRDTTGAHISEGYDDMVDRSREAVPINIPDEAFENTDMIFGSKKPDTEDIMNMDEAGDDAGDDAGGDDGDED